MSENVKITFLGKEVLEKIIQGSEKGLQKFMEKVTRDAKADAPVRGSHRSRISATEMHILYPGITGGTLRNSIDFECTDLEGRIFTQCNYGAWVELGTSSMEARPFIKPAIDKNVDKLMENIKENIKDD